MQAALEEGADFVGLVFHKASPRYVEIEVATYLANYVPSSVQSVGLFVDPSDEQLTQTLENVRLDMIQLHGSESPERIAAIKTNFQKPVIKALSLKERDDLDKFNLFTPGSDWLLLDAAGTPEQPGGHGRTFDWDILEDISIAKPWMLAGGLTPDNVADAIRRLKPDAVDVSSGVESSRGVKDADKIRAFSRNAKAAL